MTLGDLASKTSFDFVKGAKILVVDVQGEPQVIVVFRMPEV
jgi:hypothetical protein